MNVVIMGVTKGLVNKRTLSDENTAYEGTPGVSENNRALGFMPAFMDSDSGLSYLSCFADGRPAPIHIFDGLPEFLIEERFETGQIKSVKPTVISGFLHAGAFYTRDQVAAML